MACCKKKKLKALIKASTNDQLFDKNLKNSVFKCVVEIIKNSRKKKFYECFSAKTHKKLKKHKKTLKKLSSSGISLKKRKKLFVASEKEVQKLFYDHLMKDFINNCLEHD